MSSLPGKAGGKLTVSGIVAVNKGMHDLHSADYPFDREAELADARELVARLNQ